MLAVLMLQLFVQLHLLLYRPKFVLNVHPCFFTPFPYLRLGGIFSGKRIRTNRQPVANQGFSDLSLLCHKGTPSPRWRSSREWTPRRSPASWGTTAQASPWTPTPTSPGRCRRTPPKGWVTLSPKRCKIPRKRKRKYRSQRPVLPQNFPVWVLFGSKQKGTKFKQIKLSKK